MIRFKRWSHQLFYYSRLARPLSHSLAVWLFHPSIAVPCQTCHLPRCSQHASPQIAQTPSPDVDWLVCPCAVVRLVRDHGQLWGTAAPAFKRPAEGQHQSTSRMPRSVPRPASCQLHAPQTACSAWPMPGICQLPRLRHCPAAATRMRPVLNRMKPHSKLCM